MAIVGLQPTELVLRGGGLKGPAVLGGLRIEDGIAFAAISTKDHGMHEFLTGAPVYRRRLTGNRTLRELAVLRNTARADAGRQAVIQGDAEGPPAVDLSSQLGLDAEAPVQTELEQRRVARSMKYGQAALPKVTTVQFEREGVESWSVKILLNGGKEAVYMEALSANFNRLYTLVQADISNKEKQQPRGEKPPRGQKNKRQYWRKDRKRWVEKQKVPQGPDTSHVKCDSPSKKYKYVTLTRKPSDECAAEPPSKKGRRGSTVAGTGRRRQPAALEVPPSIKGDAVAALEL